MNVRKIIESYEQEKSSTAARVSPRNGGRPRPRPRPRNQGTEPSLVRTQRPPNLKIIKEERPVTIVLKVR